MVKIQVENIDIPIKKDNISLKSSIYYTTNTPLKAPWILNLAGLFDHRESYFVKLFSEKFAEAGIYVLSYDYRAHGETAKQTGKNWLKLLPKIFSDVKEVIDWTMVNNSNRILDEKIALFGRSLGGAIILTQGYIDERVKALIALCTRYDYHIVKRIKFPEETIRKISPKYYMKKTPKNNERILLAHCQDDPQIMFKNFIQIKKHLGLRDENALEFETGRHSFKGHRDEIFERSIEFIKKI